MFYFTKRNINLAVSFTLVLAILFIYLTTASFAQKTSSSRPDPFPISSNNNDDDDGRKPIKPGILVFDENKIGRDADSFYIRSENFIGCKDDYSSTKKINEFNSCINSSFFSEQKEIVLPAESKGFVDLPKMASKFVVDKNNTDVAITFSALADNYSPFNGPLLVRVLVDGQVANPNQITLLGGNDDPFTAQVDDPRSSVQSFTFFTTVNEGIHTVQVQYSTEFINSGDSFLRNATLKINTEAFGKAEKESLKHNGTNWQDVPNADMQFEVPENGEVAITFSSEVLIEKGNSLLLKAVIDNGLSDAVPGEITLANRMYHTEARSVVFTANGLLPGVHTIKFEWRNSDSDTISQMKAWSILVMSKPKQEKDKLFDVIQQADSLFTNDSEYQQVPGLTTDISVDEVSDIAVTLSGYFSGIHYAVATVTIDGVPQTDNEVAMHNGTWDCLVADKSGFECEEATELENSGARSYTFAIKNLSPKNSPYEIGIAFRKGGGNVVEPPGGGIYFHAIIDDSLMIVEKKLRIGPDLAVGPNMGRGSKKRERIIEPIYGSRQLLTIIIDPIYGEFPVDTSYLADIDDTINGNSTSVKDYYQVVSNGRLSIEKAGIFGPYLADNAGVISNGVNYYKDSSNFGCDNGKEFDSGGDALHAEAILQADSSIDFSQYDLNNDGVIMPNELGIIIAIPADTNNGSSIAFNPYCNQSLIVDGVKITEMVHLNTFDTDFGSDIDAKINNLSTAAHELGHHFLSLDDMYTSGMHTTPGKLSLMDRNFDSTNHIDGFHKLHLGWARPSILEKEKEFALFDVKTNEDVFILPRRNTDAHEYVVLEFRYDEATPDYDLYDYNILDSGLGVYHIIEPDDSCKINYEDFDSPIAAAPDCKPLQTPVCISDDTWLGGHFSNFVRVGFRLISPDLSHRNDDGKIDYMESLFGVGAGALFEVDLLDNGITECPEKAGYPLPKGSSPYLIWGDGNPSGYKLFDIEIDAIANKTNFILDIK